MKWLNTRNRTTQKSYHEVIILLKTIFVSGMVPRALHVVRVLHKVPNTADQKNVSNRVYTFFHFCYNMKQHITDRMKVKRGPKWRSKTVFSSIFFLAGIKLHTV